MLYVNLENCLGAIQFMEAMGMTDKPEYADACRQRDAFLTEQNASKEIDEKEYIFSTLKKNSKFHVSEEKEKCVRETVDAL